VKLSESLFGLIKLNAVERGWKRIPREYSNQLKGFTKNKERLLKFQQLNETDYYAIHDKILWTFAVRAAMEPVRNYKPRGELEPGGFRDSLENECLEILAKHFGVLLDEVLNSKKSYLR
jgi:hypothetical protein